MCSRESENCGRLRDSFEGREAIYIDKGVRRVRVTNIRCNVAGRYINADVEAISTPVLEGGVFHGRRASSLGWRIGAGYLTTFSDQTWQMGYGGWSLFFAQEIVEGLTNVAGDWPDELSAGEKYERALRFLEDHNARQPVERVFPD